MIEPSRVASLLGAGAEVGRGDGVIVFATPKGPPITATAGENGGSVAVLESAEIWMEWSTADGEALAREMLSRADIACDTPHETPGRTLGGAFTAIQALGFTTDLATVRPSGAWVRYVSRRDHRLCDVSWSMKDRSLSAMVARVTGAVAPLVLWTGSGPAAGINLEFGMIREMEPGETDARAWLESCATELSIAVADLGARDAGA